MSVNVSVCVCVCACVCVCREVSKMNEGDLAILPEIHTIQ